jgi:hypothetical protein
MKIDVTVPADAQLGEYKGVINISTSPAGAPRNGVSVNLGGNVKIDLVVTSIQVSDFSIQNFKIPDVAKGSPIKFVIKVKNDGNTENGPTKADLTFFDQYGTSQLDQQTADITEKVQPFQVKDVSVEVPNNLDIGTHWAGVKIYSNDKTIVDSKIVFNVIAQPAASKQQKAANALNISVWIYSAVLAAAIILMVILLKISILHKKSKK